MNREVQLARRPVGAVTRDDFSVANAPRPEPSDGEFRVRVTHISMDPAMRGWMNEGRSYVPPVAIGETMRALAVGTVDASNHSGFAVGQTVSGLFGVQRYAISDGRDVQICDTEIAPPESWTGGLGMPGRTAYLGLLKVGQPKPGETVVVSAASGAVGSIVGQIAKLHGCRAVGIAGGAEKCRHLTETLGFDAAVDYKAGDLAAQLRTACPDGIDVYFENVGGEILDTVLAQMNPFGRIPVCGLISAYNATSALDGPKNLRTVLVHRLRMQGFIVFDFIDQYAEANSALQGWVRDGKIKLVEDVRDASLAEYPDVLNDLFTGGNFGKLVMRLTD